MRSMQSDKKIILQLLEIKNNQDLAASKIRLQYVLSNIARCHYIIGHHFVCYE